MIYISTEDYYLITLTLTLTPKVPVTMEGCITPGNNDLAKLGREIGIKGPKHLVTRWYPTGSAVRNGSNDKNYDFAVTYMGCFEDPSDSVLRLLPTGPLAYGYTAASCRRACGAASPYSASRYYGLRAGGFCSCGFSSTDGNTGSALSRYAWPSRSST